jgi:hypothetical protein
MVSADHTLWVGGQGVELGSCTRMSRGHLATCMPEMLVVPACSSSKMRQAFARDETLVRYFIRRVRSEVLRFG